MSLLDLIDDKPLSQEEIEKEIKRAEKLIDYTVGDWVETCAFLPGIVEKVNNYYNRKKLYFEDDVEIFYPHYKAKYNDGYNGGSSCSIFHCGVHKITPEYAKMLFAVGNDALTELYDKAAADWDNGIKKDWSEYVKEAYNLLEDKNAGIDLFNIGEDYSKKITKK